MATKKKSHERIFKLKNGIHYSIQRLKCNCWILHEIFGWNVLLVFIVLLSFNLIVFVRVVCAILSRSFWYSFCVDCVFLKSLSMAHHQSHKNCTGRGSDVYLLHCHFTSMSSRRRKQNRSNDLLFNLIFDFHHLYLTLQFLVSYNM